MHATWRASPRVAYTESSSDQVTRFSWISHRRSSTPWTKCSVSSAPGRSLETIAPPNRRPERSREHHDEASLVLGPVRVISVLLGRDSGCFKGWTSCTSGQSSASPYCAPLQGPSPTRALIGFFVVTAGVLAILYALKPRTRP